ncbi:MAG: hypothetical protein ACTSR8_03180 [Promethearchaeota archaeon]
MLQILNPNWQANFTSIGAFILWILLFLVFLFIVAIFLKIGLSMTDAEKTEFSSVFATALVITIFFMILSLFIIGTYWWLILLIALLLMWLIIAKRHEITFLKAILVTVIALIAFIVTIWLIAYLFHIQMGFVVF